MTKRRQLDKRVVWILLLILLPISILLAKSTIFVDSRANPSEGTDFSGEKPVQAPVTQTPLVNLIRNPGFERDDDADGTADRWSISDGEKVIRTKDRRHMGTYSLSLQPTNGGAYMLRQTGIGVAPNTSYTAALYYYAPVNSISSPYVFSGLVAWKDEAGNTLREDQFANPSDYTDTWTRAEIAEIRSPERAVSADVIVRGEDLVSQVFLDDIVLRQL